MPTQFLMTRYDARIARAGEGLLTEADLARATGLHPELIRRLYCTGVLEAAEERENESLFAPTMVLRLRRALRLRRDLGLSWHGLGIVTELLERIDTLEARLRHLESRLTPP